MASNFFTSFQAALSNPTAYSSFQKEMSTKAVEQIFFNSFSGKTVFRAFVISETAGDVQGQAIQHRAIRVRPIDVHDFIIPEPCSFEKYEERKRVIALHPVAYPDSNYDIIPGTEQNADIITLGHVVECFFNEGPQENGKLRGLMYRPVIISKSGRLNLECLRGNDFNSDPAKRAFGGGNYGKNTPTGDKFPDGTPVVSNFGGNHVIEKIEKNLKADDKIVYGFGAPIASIQANAEIDFWKDKNEKDVGTKGNVDKTNPAYKRIQLYNYYGKQDRAREKGESYRKVEEYWPKYTEDELLLKVGVGGSSDEGTGDGTTGIMHWSATSVSWCMRGTGFPARLGHSGYSQNIAMKKSPGWEAFSLIRQKIMPSLGDVVVRTGGHGKKDTTFTASHGDIIYKIDSNYAYTAGGNLGPRGQFKEANKLKLAPDGTILSPAPYLIILKKQVTKK